MGVPGDTMQLKRVNWEKLSIAGLENTVWARLGQNEPSEEVIEFIQLEQSFSAIQKAASKEEKKPEKPAVMNPKKTYNIAILLGHLKMPFEEIKNALLAMDEKKFSEAHLKQLHLYAPDNKELQKFKHFADDVSKLDKADRFCYEMSKVSWYKQRLKALLFKARFADKVEEIKPDLEAVLDASQELRKSPKLQKILELVLKMGNYMNKGNMRIGSAVAFKIEYLNKLSNTKTSDNKSTLLHFLVQTIESKCPEVLNIKEEIPSVPTAARVSGQMVAGEVEDLVTKMKELQTDLGVFRSMKSQDPNDRFSLAVKSIIDDTEGELNELLSLQQKSTKEFRETAKFFGEKETTATTEDFFGIFGAFLMNFDRAHAENVAKLKLKEEQAKREQQKQERARQKKISLERSMSDPDMESQEELKKAVQAVKRKQSGEMSPRSPTSPSFTREMSPRSPTSPSFTAVVSPRSAPTSPSLNGAFSDTEVKIMKADSTTVESEPDGWTVVDVNLDAPTNQKPSTITSEKAKPPVSAKPKPAPPLKPKPKSPIPDRGNSVKNFIFTVKTAGENTKSSKIEQPKGTETKTARKVESPKRFSDYAEILNSEAESKKTPPSPSPSGGVKSRMSLFEGGGPVKPPVYAKPDMSKKKAVAKSPDQSNNKLLTAVENSYKEDTPEEPPSLPGRHYTAEDLALLTPTPKPQHPPPPVRNSPPETSPKGYGLNSLRNSTTPEQTSQNDTDNTYEVVEARNVKPSFIALQKKPVPSTPPHNKRIESRKDLSPAPPSPFKDSVPPPPVRSVSLSSASLPSNGTSELEYSEVVQLRDSPPVRSESPYSEVEDTRRTPKVHLRDSSLMRSESPYSEVEDTRGTPEVTRKIPEVEAYYTTDVVRNLPTKASANTKRKPPVKPAPYKLNKITGDEPQAIIPPPPIPAPYRPKNLPKDLSNSQASTDKEEVQSPGTPDSPRLPVVTPGTPRLHSAKVVSDLSPSSLLSSPVVDSPPRFKPPPPPRVSSIADTTKEEITSQAPVPDFSYFSPVNSIAEQEDNEIPTRDFDVVSTFPKPFLLPKPQLGSQQNHINEGSVKPPPHYDVKSGSLKSDHERAGSQNGVDSLVIAPPPPPMDWLDSKDERAASTTSIDSLDLKIVPPPPVHFKELDPVKLTFAIQAIDPPSDWQERTDKNGNLRTSKKGSPKIAGTTDLDFSIVPPPPPPSGPPPTLPVGGAVDYDLDLVPSLLSNGPGDFSINIDDIFGDLDKSFSLPASDDEDSLPPAPLPPGERYYGVPPPPGDARIKPLVPPLRKQR